MEWNRLNLVESLENLRIFYDYCLQKINNRNCSMLLWREIHGVYWGLGDLWCRTHHGSLIPLLLLLLHGLDSSVVQLDVYLFRNVLKAHTSQKREDSNLWDLWSEHKHTHARSLRHDDNDFTLEIARANRKFLAFPPRFVSFESVCSVVIDKNVNKPKLHFN